MSKALAPRITAKALEVTLRDLGDEALEKAKVCLLDFVSCALEARHLPWSQQARAVTPERPSGAGLIGNGTFASPADAAFANAVAGHGLVREDMHAGAVAHLGVVVWPALLACAARERASGAQLALAAIVGYEVGAKLGRALMSPDLARLFRPTGLVGAPAATVALACLSRCDALVAAHALSLAANAVAGLNQWPHTGGSEMYFHPGFAARNGVTALDLARAGAIASLSILEGEGGMFAAYARTAETPAIEPFAGEQAEILAVFNKEVPACNFAQTPCQVALRALAKIGPGERIEGIVLRVTEAAERYPGCNGRGPFEYPLQAKMSIPFSVAAALSSGKLAEANYAQLDDPETARLIGVTHLTIDSDLTAAFPRRQGAAIRLELANGRVVEEALDDVLPASAELVRDRFMSNAQEAWGPEHAEVTRALVERLEDQVDAGRLDLLCARSAGERRAHA